MSTPFGASHCATPFSLWSPQRRHPSHERPSEPEPGTTRRWLPGELLFRRPKGQPAPFRCSLMVRDSAVPPFSPDPMCNAAAPGLGERGRPSRKPPAGKLPKGWTIREKGSTGDSRAAAAPVPSGEGYGAARFKNSLVPLRVRHAASTLHPHSWSSRPFLLLPLLLPLLLLLLLLPPRPAPKMAGLAVAVVEFCSQLLPGVNCGLCWNSYDGSISPSCLYVGVSHDGAIVCRSRSRPWRSRSFATQACQSELRRSLKSNSCQQHLEWYPARGLL